MSPLRFQVAILRRLRWVLPLSGGGPSLSDLMAAIKSIKGEVREELKEAISEAVVPIYTKITKIEENVQSVQKDLGETAAKVIDLEDQMKNMRLGGGNGGGEDTQKLQKQIDDMSEKVNYFGNHGNPADPTVIATDIVIGGMTDFT